MIVGLAFFAPPEFVATAFDSGGVTTGPITVSFIMALGIGFGDDKVIGYFMVVGSVVFFIALIQAFIFYSCPHCGYSLMNVRGEVPEYCPKCGKEL